MSGTGPNVAELATQLQQALDTALAQNEQLADQIKESEARAKAAELRARETEEKLHILESLKTKEYQTVVTELFEGPSRRAVRLTVLVAMASILIGLTQTIMSSIYSSRTNAAAVVKLSQSLRSELQSDIAKSATQTKREVGVMLSALTNNSKNEPKAVDLQPDVPVNASIGLNEDRYYQINVPSGTPRLEVVLTYSSSDKGHSHIYVRHESVQARHVEFRARYVNPGECVNGHVGSPDRCIFTAPLAGRWIVQVRGFAASNYQLAASLHS